MAEEKIEGGASGSCEAEVPSQPTDEPAEDASEAEDEEPSVEYRDIRNRFRFIPFGKFSPSGWGTEPFNQVMVGRLKDRANFIKRLTEHDRFGAVLVSGRRGSGKTSFVRYCLHAYRQESFVRFRRRVIERGGQFRSNILGALFGVVLAIMLTLYSQGIELAVYNRLRFEGASTYWLVALTALMMLVPLLFVWSGWRSLRAVRLLRWVRHDITEYRSRRRERFQKWLLDRKLWHIVIIVALVIASIWTFQEVAPESFYTWTIRVLTIGGVAQEPLKLWQLVGIVYIFLFSSALVAGIFEYYKRFFEVRQFQLILWSLSLSIILSGLFIQATELKGARSLSTPEAMALFVVALTIATAMGSFFGERAMQSAGTKELKTKISQRGLPVEILLFGQAVFCFAIAFTFFAPALVLGETALYFGDNDRYSMDNDGKSAAARMLADGEITGPVFTLIEWSRIDLSSTVIIAAYLVLLVSLQQSWIGKGMAAERQDSALNLLGPHPDAVRAKHIWNSANGRDEEHALNHLLDKEGNWNKIAIRRLRRRGHIARQVERSTFARAYYAMRSPVLVLWMNLGFDDLRHARIIEAMLSELRARYHGAFCTLRSPTYLLNVVLLVLGTLALTRLVAAPIFDYGIDRPIGEIDERRAESDGDGLAQDTTSLRDPLEVSDGEGQPNSRMAPADREASSNDDSRLIINAELANGQVVLAASPEEAKDVGNLNFEGDVGGKNPDYCNYFVNNPNEAPPATAFICILPWNNYVLSGLYRPILTLDYPDGRRPVGFSFLGERPNVALITIILDYSSDLPTIQEEGNDEPSLTISLRAYHLLLFFFCGFLLIKLNRKLQLAPYGNRVREMDDLLERIRGRVTSTTSDGPDTGFVPRLFGLRRQDRTTEAEPDPRIVEQSFLDLMRRVGTGRSGGRGPLDVWESPPEIVFVFDEMDKLSGRVDVENARTDEAGTAVEENARDRARSLQLHQLLSDMKRLLGSNAARFVFIGSRLYHDEWLADQANRSPLLSSIFSEEMYLTSLLTDRDHPYGRLNDRIAEYFILLYQNAESRLLLPNGRLEEPAFIQAPMPDTAHPRRVVAMADRVSMRVLNDKAKPYGSGLNEGEQAQSKRLTAGGRETVEQLLNFLTYRSGGNPKRIQELIGDLVQPKALAANLPGRSYSDRQKLAFGTDGARGSAQEHNIRDDDCLVLDDRALYRMQFIDLLYRHICDHLEDKIMDRDDKVAMSVFYLMDFLLKFHNRGFLLTNLQRVDELSHIHRAPDLRSLMGALVNISSERFLHRVLNGVITYRFRSDFAREIDYLSRISTNEMAALNFTLDESQSLKGLYQQTLRTGDHDNIDTVAGLGELYEYDQDYEIARNYYRRAINLMDERFRKEAGFEFKGGDEANSTVSWDLGEGKLTLPKSGAEGTWNAAGFILQCDNVDEARPLIRANLPWALARVRLGLQIGHTYEQEHNYERARASYMHAIRLSDAILGATSSAESGGTQSKTGGMEKTLSVNGASLLHQARFATAWVLEKDNQDIDESTYQVEAAVYELYNRNPILLKSKLRTRIEQKAPSSSRKDYYPNETNIVLLTASDVHNKSGDLYFYKGKTRPRNVRVNDLKVGRLGYLRRAQRHYASSLYHVRGYIHSRSEMSAFRLGPSRDEDHIKSTILADGDQPDMVQNALGNTLTDLAETILAQSSISGIVACFPRESNGDKPSVSAQVAELRRAVQQDCASFLECMTDEFRDPSSRRGEKHSERSLLNDLNVFGFKWCAGLQVHWIGEWNKAVKATDHLKQNHPIEFGAQDKANTERGMCDDFQRLVAYLFLSSTAAKVYSDAGYPVDAANEYLLQAQTLVSTIWATRYLEKLEDLDEVKDRAGAYKDQRNKDGLQGEIDISGLRACLGVFAIHALEMAYHELELAHRPSTTGFSQNRGQPDESLRDHPSKLSSDDADPMAWEKFKEEHEETQIWRDDPRFKTLAAGLALALSDVAQNGGEGDRTHEVASYAYDNLLRRYARPQFPERVEDEIWTHRDMRAAFQGLYRTNERHRYPILNRLNTFKHQLDAALIVGEVLFMPSGVSEEDGCKEQKSFVGRVSNELLATANLYGSDLHFSPHKSGSALALAAIHFADSDPRAFFDPLGAVLFERETADDWSYFKKGGQPKGTDPYPDLPNVAFTQESLEASAITELRRSEEMHGLGRAYYENIAPLSYLNDDFNDRKIHFSHASRMLMSDVTDLLLHALATQREQ